MSKVLSTKITFTPSASTDVVGYKLYIQPAPDAVTYESQAFDLGNKTEVFISDIPGLSQADGVYNLGIAAVDDSGNEADLRILENVSLDFFAPEPVSDLKLVRD
jgi:hypothetical protein